MHSKLLSGVLLGVLFCCFCGGSQMVRKSPEEIDKFLLAHPDLPARIPGAQGPGDIPFLSPVGRSPVLLQTRFSVPGALPVLEAAGLDPVPPSAPSSRSHDPGHLRVPFQKNMHPA